ncbi:cytochrome P450 [Mycena maculata]|uniref:Cytochrome P450 n=1 Tax=Mycena maculata TaxID=230809 RepID=A0AAD7P2E3_9AGAR|nr:cytochrome P450 [Mycena maculata]
MGIQIKPNPLAAYVVRAICTELISPVRDFPGPPSTHWFWGNFKEILKDQDSGLAERWAQQYGPTIKRHSFFKAEATRAGLSRLVGPGVLVVEGEEHKHQNPAFGAPQIRELTSIFVDTSIQLRDIWAAQVSKDGGVARIEVLHWLSKTTLDIIGLAGFNYKINALGTDANDTPDKLAEAFEALFAAETGFSIVGLLQALFPVLRRLPTRRGNTFNKSRATIDRIAATLLADSKRQVAESGAFETGRGRDFLTLLVRANTSKEIPAGQRLSDEDVLAQVPTFLVAGHETTSTALTWALFALTQNMAAQTRLREELLSVSTENPTMEELNELKYLDCVVRETLRVYAPVTSTSRVALRDDVVPLGTPVTDNRGIVHETLRIRKGDTVPIPIVALNRDAGLWGPDAMEFKPERWESEPAVANGIPGIWGHTLTFLGGPRSCIGYRFSLVETKALLFTLVRTFEFELAVPVEDIGRKPTAIVQRPTVRSEPAAGNQLPLRVRAVAR